MNIKKWRKVVREHFPEFVIPAEIGLSVVSQLFIDDITNPFGLIYTDVASAGKTIVLNFFSELDDLVYCTDDFTPASLVSHAANVATDNLPKVDLLPKIKDRLLLVRDFAPTLGKRPDDIIRLMGIMTRVFDGEGLMTNSGIHGLRGYQGKHLFMFLTASTPISSRTWTVMSKFGTRMFSYNFSLPRKKSQTLVDQISSAPIMNKEKACRRVTAELAQTLKKRGKVFWKKEREDKKLLFNIVQYAELVAFLRGYINEDEVPCIEASDRASQCFYNLARGHAIASGREYLDQSDVSMVARVALSSASLPRTRVIKALIENGGELTAREIEKITRLSKPTVLKFMKELNQLGLTRGHVYICPADQKGRPPSCIRLAKRFNLLLTKEYKDLHDLADRQ